MLPATIRTLALIAGLGVLLATAHAEEEGKEITIDQVPAAVKATILAQANGAKLTEIEVETKHGKQVYEAEFENNGATVKVVVDAAGVLLKTKVEKEDGDKDEKEDDEKGEKKGEHKHEKKEGTEK